MKMQNGQTKLATDAEDTKEISEFLDEKGIIFLIIIVKYCKSESVISTHC